MPSPRLGQLDLEHTDLGVRRRLHLAAERCRQQLMAEADAEIGHPVFQDRLADRLLLRPEPGMLGFLPDVLGAAHDQEPVVFLERRDRLARLEGDHVPFDAVRAQAVTEDAGMGELHVLKDE